MVDANATVHLFAALRDAAGTADVAITAPIPLGEVLEDLRARFGERFAERMAIAAVMVDGMPVEPTADVVVMPGSEVALLPPFAGGCGSLRAMSPFSQPARIDKNGNYLPSCPVPGYNGAHVRAGEHHSSAWLDDPRRDL